MLISGEIYAALKEAGASGRWLLDSVFDDKSFAIEEAKALKGRFKSIPGVCVVAVSEENGEFRELKVFEHSIAGDESAIWKTVQIRPEAPAVSPKVAGTHRREGAAPKQPRRRGAWAYYAQLGLGIAVVVAVGLLGFAAVRMLR
jgi:hypothetical protein